jgi:hypothetical protein
MLPDRWSGIQTISKGDCMKTYDDDELNVLLEFAVREGYLEIEKLGNGKNYYRRTDKPLPLDEDEKLRGMFPN